MAACKQDTVAVVENVVEEHDACFSPRNLFSQQLFCMHVDEARLWVRKCKQLKQSPLDVCGERGDLYFLLKANPWLLRE
jgi:hypothetical protein